MFNPTVNIRTQSPDSIQRQRDMSDHVTQRALSGGGSAMPRLAAALMANIKNKRLDKTQAQNKADAEAKAQAAAAQQGALL